MCKYFDYINISVCAYNYKVRQIRSRTNKVSCCHTVIQRNLVGWNSLNSSTPENRNSFSGHNDLVTGSVQFNCTWLEQHKHERQNEVSLSKKMDKCKIERLIHLEKSLENTYFARIKWSLLYTLSSRTNNRLIICYVNSNRPLQTLDIQTAEIFYALQSRQWQSK